MIRIEDTTLRQMVLLMLVQLAERGEYQPFLDAGIPLDEVDQIRSISLDELVRMCEMPSPLIYISIDNKSWTHSMRILSRIKKIGRQLDYFFTNGASLSMVKKLFKGHEADITVFREIHAANINRGRPKLPPLAVRDRIHANWQKIQKDLGKAGDVPLRDMYVELHKLHPDLRLDAIDAVLEDS